MAEPLKDLISPASVARLSAQLQAGTPAFPADAFAAEASAGLASLELKARVRHVAAVLRRHLPAEGWRSVLVAGAGPPLPDAEQVSAGMYLWPLLDVVEVYGLDQPAASLAALQELTRRFSAEFAVRPYLLRHPEVAWPALRAWAQDADVHVRRLASEGSRPRLPWGAQLRASVVDPAPGLEILEILRGDPEPYVRRSVANHLNDIGRDHPDLAVATGARWLGEAPGSAERRAMVRHGLRGLLKAGHPGALAALGHAPPASVEISGIAAAPAVVRLCPRASVTISCWIEAASAQALVVDLVVRYPRQDGSTSRRVFKGTEVRLAAGERYRFQKAVPMRPVTTRRHYPGRYEVSAQVNGEILATTAFVLEGGGDGGGSGGGG